MDVLLICDVKSTWVFWKNLWDPWRSMGYAECQDQLKWKRIYHLNTLVTPIVAAVGTSEQKTQDSSAMFMIRSRCRDIEVGEE